MIHNQKFNLAYFLLIAIAIGSRAAAEDCCEPGDIKPDEDDCTKYFVCCTGQFKPMSCPSGEYFNVDQGKCVPDNGECNCNGTACIEGDHKADTNNCANFLVCVNGQYESVSCPSGNYWNVNQGECQEDKGQCNGTPTPPPVTPTPPPPVTPTPPPPVTPTPPPPVTPTPPPPTCVEGELEVNPTDCAGYLECINNVLVKRQCPAQSYFDKNLKICVVDDLGICIPKVCDAECCDKPNNWLGPIDKNCSAFMQCLFGNVFQHKCPNNLQFNTVTNECDYPENVQCDDGTAPPSGPTAGPSGTYCESKGRCVGLPDGAMLADANDVCSGAYVVCQCECEVNFKCSGGLVFNTKINTCDWPANVDC